MGSRILLADDSITIQKVVNLTFADEGIEVVAVSNGDLAERRLNEVKPDLVLADIFMPGKNGYELCEAIKENPQFRNVPVVLLVGAFEPFDQAEARRVRADAHLTKPFESRTLVETVRRLISASGRVTTGPIAPLPSPGEGRDDADRLQPRIAAPAAQRLDASEMMVDPNASSTPSSIGKTGELASVRADANTPVFNVDAQESSVHESLGDNTAGATHFDPIELPSIGDASHGELQSSSEPDHLDVFLDFDKEETAEPSAPVKPLSFETETASEAETDGASANEEAEWFSQDHFESRPSEMPGSNKSWQTSLSTAPSNGQPADFRRHTEAAFASSEHSAETATATMLAGDDPLGDLLLDEGISTETSPFGHDFLDIELTEPALIEPPSGVDTQFDLVDAEEVLPASLQTAATVVNSVDDELELHHTAEPIAMVDQPDAEASVLAGDARTDDARTDFVESDDILDWTSGKADLYSDTQPDSVTMPMDGVGPQLDSLTMPLDPAQLQLDSMAMTTEFDVAQPEVDSASMPLDVAQPQFDSVSMPLDVPEPQVESLTPPFANAHSLADSAALPFAGDQAQSRTDFEMAPIEAVQPQSQSDSVADSLTTDSSESLAAQLADTKQGSDSTQEASFESARMWPEEEARFAAIDIEAFPVVESAGPSQSPVTETGFSLSSIPDEQSGSAPEVTTVPVMAAEPSSNGASHSAELSSATIEEIVRRVVAEMSESVVREVAWEVVPDCVERVIDQLTRESLSRRA